jgi:hypothetical protein
VIGMIKTFYESLVWFRHTISHWYDLDILSVIDMIQTYHQSLANDWWYVWIIPMTDNMSESYQWLIFYLNHTNNWWYTWIMPMTDNIPESCHWLHIISYWYDSNILWVNGMIQVYYQSLAWFRYIISSWYDSDIISVIGITQTYYQSLVWFRHIISHLCLNHTNDW